MSDPMGELQFDVGDLRQACDAAVATARAHAQLVSDAVDSQRELAEQYHEQLTRAMEPVLALIGDLRRSGATRWDANPLVWGERDGEFCGSITLTHDEHEIVLVCAHSKMFKAWGRRMDNQGVQVEVDGVTVRDSSDNLAQLRLLGQLMRPLAEWAIQTHAALRCHRLARQAELDERRLGDVIGARAELDELRSLDV